MDFYSLFNEYTIKIKEFNKKNRTDFFFFVEKNIFLSLCFESFGMCVIFMLLSMIKNDTIFLGLLACLFFFFLFFVMTMLDKVFINNSKEYSKKKTLERYEVLVNLLREKKITLKKETLEILINMASYNKENLKTKPSTRMTNIFDQVVSGVLVYFTQEFLNMTELEGLQVVTILIIEFLVFAYFIIPEIKNIFRKKERLYNEFIYDLQSIYLLEHFKKQQTTKKPGTKKTKTNEQ